MNSIRDICIKRFSRIAVISIGVLVVLFSVYNTRYLLRGNDEGIIPVAQEIGEIVGHSTKTLMLAQHYGKPLLYHGEIGGVYWPRRALNWKYRRSGERELTLQERLDNIGFMPEYFIITDFEEFSRHHADLKEFVARNCSLIAANEKHYLIYGDCIQR